MYIINNSISQEPIRAQAILFENFPKKKHFYKVNSFEKTFSPYSPVNFNVTWIAPTTS